MATTPAVPTMFMIAGPNGAGKSTFYALVLKPNVAAPFINADHIQKDELKDERPEASYKAAEMARERRAQFLAEGKSFVAESVFSHTSKLDEIREARAAGFRVVMYHVSVRSETLSIARVKSRVEQGGHDVPEQKIRDRFNRNGPIIRAAVKMADRAHVYDNSHLGKAPERVLSMRAGKVDYASDKMPVWAREIYAEDLKSFSPARLNQAADSYKEISKIAAQQAGKDVPVGVARKGKTYTGRIVGESRLHVLQEQAGAYIGHFRSALSRPVRLGETLSITYISRARANLSAAPAASKADAVETMPKAVDAIKPGARQDKAQNALNVMREAGSDAKVPPSPDGAKTDRGQDDLEAEQ